MIHRTFEALAGLRQALPDLEEALIPGTPRRWAQHDITDAQRTRMDATARLEREAKAANIAKGFKALGDGKAPIRLDVLDVLDDIETSVADLEDAVTERLGTTPLAGATTAERITRLIGLLDRIAYLDDLAEHVADEAHRMRSQARRALGDTEPVRRVDVRCPICGARSLRAFLDRELIVCVNGACCCWDQACGCNAERPRRHRWPLGDWPEVAETLTTESHHGGKMSA